MNEMADYSVGFADWGEGRKGFEMDTQKYLYNVKLESFIISEYGL